MLVGIGLIALLIAVPMELAALRRLRRLQLARGTFFFLGGAVVLGLGAIAALVAINLFTYARLTNEQEAARVSIRQLEDKLYVVSLQTRRTPARHFQVRGDEWQIDARVLKWRPVGNLVGLDTLFRLERLSGRYGSIAAERSAPRTVYSLAPETPLDVWAVLRQHRYIPLADALYGSAAYVPMAEGADYVVSVSQSGLVVRPANDAARKAVGGWK